VPIPLAIDGVKAFLAAACAWRASRARAGTAECRRSDGRWLAARGRPPGADPIVRQHQCDGQACFALNISEDGSSLSSGMRRSPFGNNP